MVLQLPCAVAGWGGGQEEGMGEGKEGDEEEEEGWSRPPTAAAAAAAGHGLWRLCGWGVGACELVCWLMEGTYPEPSGKSGHGPSPLGMW